MQLAAEAKLVNTNLAVTSELREVQAKLQAYDNRQARVGCWRRDPDPLTFESLILMTGKGSL